MYKTKALLESKGVAVNSAHVFLDGGCSADQRVVHIAQEVLVEVWGTAAEGQPRFVVASNPGENVVKGNALYCDSLLGMGNIQRVNGARPCTTLHCTALPLPAPPGLPARPPCPISANFMCPISSLAVHTHSTMAVLTCKKQLDGKTLYDQFTPIMTPPATVGSTVVSQVDCRQTTIDITVVQGEDRTNTRANDVLGTVLVRCEKSKKSKTRQDLLVTLTTTRDGKLE